MKTTLKQLISETRRIAHLLKSADIPLMMNGKPVSLKFTLDQDANGEYYVQVEGGETSQNIEVFSTEEMKAELRRRAELAKARKAEEAKKALRCRNCVYCEERTLA